MSPLPDPRAVADAFGLPGRAASLDEVGGAWSNRLFRLEVGGERYALKQVLDPWHVDGWFDRIDEAWAFEQRAVEAGVSAPPPIPNPRTGSWRADVVCDDGSTTATVRLHRWVDGEPAPTDVADEGFARWAGATVATLHAIAMVPPRPEVFPRRETTNVHRWPALVARLEQAGVAWAAQAADASDAVARIGELYRVHAEAEQRMGHRDVDQKNVLLTSAGPCLCDWDVAGPVAPRAEIVDVALSMARWQRPEIARATIDAYRRAGGELDAVSPADVAPMLLSSVDWITLNVERAVGDTGTPREQQLGLELAPTRIADLTRKVEIALDIGRFLGE